VMTYASGSSMCARLSSSMCARLSSRFFFGLCIVVFGNIGYTSTEPDGGDRAPLASDLSADPEAGRGERSASAYRIIPAVKR
jgi:hypothetical protein